MKPQKIVALVPMRHHSVRVPGKNYRPLAGKPLFHHILDTLLACPEITQIAVDTDSPVIMESLAKEYPQVQALLHDTSLIPADLYLQTHSTNPLLRAETISAAIRALVDNFPTYDSLFGATRIQTRLWDQLTRPINHNPAILLRTQDLPPIYEENSCIYIFTRQTLEAHRNRLGDRPYLFPISRDEAWDIDEELDFLVADLLLRHQQGLV
jgi:CMP-N-acetylneuraminic acid synthetase